jgi:hypothetical protein
VDCTDIGLPSAPLPVTCDPTTGQPKVDLGIPGLPSIGVPLP